MGRILILDPQVAAQIAAGEVILRPAAAVKELVENALDAGAQSISVEMEEGGRRRLRVVDDGCGMTPAEAHLSLERHATSKLRAETDLLNITTLGFRGEALPSIAAVSRLELITRPPGAQAGYRLVARAGEIQEAAPWAAPVGTQVVVEDLFFNTPARRKFLKSREAEGAYILESMRHLALGFPEVHFLLKNPAKTLLAAPPHASLTERVAALYGAELAAHLLPVALGSDPFGVAGLISGPDFSLATNRFQVFLVNRRVVQDRILGAVLKEVYQGLLPKGRHAAAVVLLTLPPEQLDVNVHPAKVQVRFQDPGRIYSLLIAALRQGLGLPKGPGPSYTVTWHPQAAPQAREGTLGLAPVPTAPAPGAFTPPAEAPAPILVPTPGFKPFRFQDLAILGQLNNTYILAQGAEGLLLIDQHAAHERILYEALKAKGPGASQPLLFPRVVEVPPAQADWLREHLAEMSRAGLELEDFGGAAFLLTAAPAALPPGNLEAVVLAMVEALAPLKSSTAPQDVVDQALTLMACHGALKAGQPLKLQEIQALLAQLDGLEVSSHCPHGRPLWRVISYGEIHRSFRRPRD